MWRRNFLYLEYLISEGGRIQTKGVQICTWHWASLQKRICVYQEVWKNKYCSIFLIANPYNSECCFRGSLLNLAESNFQNYNHSISIRLVFDYHSIGITEFDSEHLIFQNIWTNNNGWERINSLLSCKKWDKVFKSGLSKSNGRQPLKNFKGYGLLMS